MTKPIIEVHDLSKLYRLGVIGLPREIEPPYFTGRATTLRDSFDRWWQRLRRNDRRSASSISHPASSISHPASSIQ